MRHRRRLHCSRASLCLADWSNNAFHSLTWGEGGGQMSISGAALNGCPLPSGAKDCMIWNKTDPKLWGGVIDKVTGICFL